VDRKKNCGGFINLLGPVGLLFLFSSLVVGVVVVTNKDFILDLRKRASEGEYSVESLIIKTPKPDSNNSLPASSPITVTSRPRPTPRSTNRIYVTPKPKPTGGIYVTPKPTERTVIQTIGDIYNEQISDLLEKIKSQ
jgi:hypothetical protein